MKELVSIIMSVYNEDIYILEESISSILNQTYKNIEIVIVNDNPTRMDLEEFLNEKAKSNPRIVYLKNEKNIGLVNSLNRALKVTKGCYIARMDADDISYSNRIESQLSYIIEKKIDFVGANALKIDEDDNVIGEILVPNEEKDIIKYYKSRSCLLHPTWLMKKSVYEMLGGYHNIFSCEDYDFVMRAIKKGIKVGNVPRFLLKYRIRKSGVSSSFESEQRVTMQYLSKKYSHNQQVTEQNLCEYKKTSKYVKNMKKMDAYVKIKNKFKKSKNPLTLISVMFNKYLYMSIMSFFIDKKIRRKSNIIK